MQGILPDKQYFKIGEVSELVGVEPYVLRYWETEFPALKPVKSASRQRLYRRRDVETLLTIKHLLYERRYTIEGARKYLGRVRTHAEDEPVSVEKTPESDRIVLQRTRRSMMECLDALQQRAKELATLLKEFDAPVKYEPPKETVRETAPGIPARSPLSVSVTTRRTR